MRTPMRAALRLAVTGWLGLAGLLLVAAPGRAATPPRRCSRTRPSLREDEQRRGVPRGVPPEPVRPALDDPAAEAVKDDIVERADDASKTLKEKIGVTYPELIELPQGPSRSRVPEARGSRSRRAAGLTPTPARTPRTWPTS